MALRQRGSCGQICAAPRPLDADSYDPRLLPSKGRRINGSDLC